MGMNPVRALLYVLIVLVVLSSTPGLVSGSHLGVAIPHPLISSSTQPLQGYVTGTVQSVCNYADVRPSGVPDTSCLTVGTAAGIPGATITVCGGGAYNCTNNTVTTTTNNLGLWYANVTNGTSYFVQLYLPSEPSLAFNFSYANLSTCGYTASTAGKYLLMSYAGAGDSAATPVSSTVCSNYYNDKIGFTFVTTNWFNFVHQHIFFTNSTNGSNAPLHQVFAGPDVWYNEMSVSSFTGSLSSGLGDGTGVIEPLGATFTIGACIPNYYCTGNQTFHAVANTTYNISMNPRHYVASFLPKVLSGEVLGYSTTANGVVSLPVPDANISLNYTSYDSPTYAEYANITVVTHGYSANGEVVAVNIPRDSPVGLSMVNPYEVAFVNDSPPSLPPVPSGTNQLYWYMSQDFVTSTYTYFVKVPGGLAGASDVLTLWYDHNESTTNSFPAFDQNPAVFAGWENWSEYPTGPLGFASQCGREVICNNGTVYDSFVPGVAQNRFADQNGTLSSGANIQTVIGPSGVSERVLDIPSHASVFASLENLLNAVPPGTGVQLYAQEFSLTTSDNMMLGFTQLNPLGTNIVSFAGVGTTGATPYGCTAYCQSHNATIDRSTISRGSTYPSYLNETPAPASVVPPGVNSWVLSNVALNASWPLGQSCSNVGHLVTQAGWNATIGVAGHSANVSRLSPVGSACAYATVGSSNGGGMTNIGDVFAIPFLPIQPTATVESPRVLVAASPSTNAYKTHTNSQGFYTITVNSTSSAYWSQTHQLYAFVNATHTCNATALYPAWLGQGANATVQENFVLNSCNSGLLPFTVTGMASGDAPQGVSINGWHEPTTLTATGGAVRWVLAAGTNVTVDVEFGRSVQNYSSTKLPSASIPTLNIPTSDQFASFAGISPGNPGLVDVGMSYDPNNLPTNLTQYGGSVGVTYWWFSSGPFCLPISCGTQSNTWFATTVPHYVLLPTQYILNHAIYLIAVSGSTKSSICPGTSFQVRGCVGAASFGQFTTPVRIGKTQNFLGVHVTLAMSGDLSRVANITGSKRNIPTFNATYPNLPWGSSQFVTTTNASTHMKVLATYAFTVGSSNTAQGLTYIAFDAWPTDPVMNVSSTAPVTTYQISGIVTAQANGAAIKDALVNLTGGTQGYNLTYTTNGGGFYSFNVTNGTFAMSAYFPAYTMVHKNETVSGSPITLNFTLVIPGSGSGGFGLPPSTTYWVIGGIIAVVVGGLSLLWLLAPPKKRAGRTDSR